MGTMLIILILIDVEERTSSHHKVTLDCSPVENASEVCLTLEGTQPTSTASRRHSVFKMLVISRERHLKKSSDKYTDLVLDPQTFQPNKSLKRKVTELHKKTK